MKRLFFWLLSSVSLLAAMNKDVQTFKFHNNTSDNVLFSQYLCVLNYLGSDPYKGLYSNKEIITPPDIALKKNNDFAFLTCRPILLEPNRTISIKKIGIKQLYVITQWQKYSYEQENMIDEAIQRWKKKPFWTPITIKTERFMGFKTDDVTNTLKEDRKFIYNFCWPQGTQLLIYQPLECIEKNHETNKMCYNYQINTNITYNVTK